MCVFSPVINLFQLPYGLDRWVNERIFSGAVMLVFQGSKDLELNK